MTVESLLKEYGFEIDDVRWYLAVEQTTRLLSFQDDPETLTRLIWTGRLGDELYSMEEKFLAEIQDKLDRGLTDEHRVREIFREIEFERTKRMRSGI